MDPGRRRGSLLHRWTLAVLALLALGASVRPALAGPPYATDDPQPTEYRGYEIYLFAQGASSVTGRDGGAGIDFNYGGAPNLQLTAVLPLEWESAQGTTQRAGPGPVELAAKWRFVHQPQRGFDLAFFPRLILPSTQAGRGDRHASLQLPLWLQLSGERWSSFGGGGCTLRGGAGTRDHCDFGWALVRNVGGGLQLGAEVFHRGGDEPGTSDATELGVGGTWDIGAHLHLMGSVGPGLQDRDDNPRTHWYAAMLLTY
ncbi:MAG: hypothetical protein RL684_2533 [Pseudomonadota bacterium]